ESWRTPPPSAYIHPSFGNARTPPSGRFAEPPLPGDTTCRGRLGLLRAPASRPFQTTPSLSYSSGVHPRLLHTAGRVCIERRRVLLRLPCALLSQLPHL